jgi:hypothetical protein
VGATVLWLGATCWERSGLAGDGDQGQANLILLLLIFVGNPFVTDFVGNPLYDMN